MRDEKDFALRESYFRLTREILPELGQARGWPAFEEAHFQRLILDHVAGGMWYGRIKEPAILNLSKSQLKKAVRLAESLVDGRLDFEEMNEQSLRWREERGLDASRYRVPEDAESTLPPPPSAQILAFPGR